MASIKIKDDATTIDIDADGDLTLASDLVHRALHCFLVWAAAVQDLVDVKVDLEDPPSASRYSYQFEVDGRKWKQTLFVPVSGPYQATFESTDSWTQGELQPHRPLQEVIVSMIQQYGLTSFRMKR